jgi:hypothetical protein
MPDGIINVINKNDESVKGLSLAVRAKTVRINDEIPLSRQAGEDKIVWFDIPGNGCLRLSVEL